MEKVGWLQALKSLKSLPLHSAGQGRVIPMTSGGTLTLVFNNFQSLQRQANPDNYNESLLYEACFWSPVDAQIQLLGFIFAILKKSSLNTHSRNSGNKYGPCSNVAGGIYQWTFEF